MAQISTTDLAAVHVGDTAEVVIGDSASSLPGTVDNIAALVDPDTRAVAARVVVDNPHGLLKKQMYVSVRVHSRQASHGLLVPVSAILRDDENLPFVYRHPARRQLSPPASHAGLSAGRSLRHPRRAARR